MPNTETAEILPHGDVLQEPYMLDVLVTIAMAGRQRCCRLPPVPLRPGESATTTWQRRPAFALQVTPQKFHTHRALPFLPGCPRLTCSLLFSWSVTGNRKVNHDEALAGFMDKGEDWYLAWHRWFPQLLVS